MVELQDLNEEWKEKFNNSEFINIPHLNGQEIF